MGTNTQSSLSNSPIPPDKPPLDKRPPKKKPRGPGILIAILLLILLCGTAAVLYFTVHIWEDATCTQAAQCRICGVTDGRADGHDWEDADCLHPQTCDECGKEKGDSLGHDWSSSDCETAAVCSRCDEVVEAPGHVWQEATCENAATCTVCGETDGSQLGHDWRDATCEKAQWCARCGEEEGNPLPHVWLPATQSAPATCDYCGETVGEKLSGSTTYLQDLSWSEKYGKLWIHDNSHHTDGTQELDDYTAPGYYPRGAVRDALGNTYRFGIHLDGYGANTFYITYDLGGSYTTFSGTCVIRDDCLASACGKYFRIYCDGVLVYTSPAMYADTEPDTFVLDVTGVRELRIEYPPTKGANETAVLCDAWLQ